MKGAIPGNAVHLLENGHDYFPALEASLDAAEREVYLQTYIFAADATGRRIADALARAAARGVTVRVMVDGFGGREFVRSLMDELIAAGVEVQIYRRELRALSLRRHRLRRLHAKLAVIDGREAYVGGINILDDYDPKGPPFPRYDYAVRVEGPVLGRIVHSAHRLWWLLSWAGLRSRKALPRLLTPAHTAPAGDIEAAFLVRDNLRHRHDIEDAYLEAIGAARSDILIANAYFFPGRRFRAALVDAAERGVRITLVLQGVADHAIQQYATRALYPYLLDKGVRLFEYHRSQLHAKVAVIDCCWATVGSSNIDAFSLLLAREANLVVEDERFASTLRASVERAIEAGGRELRHEQLLRLPLFKRALSWLSYQFVRWAIGIAGYGDKH